jgi:hypothetical protein
MLKVLILLECDNCTALIATSADSSRKDGLAWAAEAENLEYDAQQSGWDIFRSHHTCNGCIAEAQYEQEQSRS